jgi:hypothetical protein
MLGLFQVLFEIVEHSKFLIKTYQGVFEVLDLNFEPLVLEIIVHR